jgi:hypothetical protein
MFGRNTHGRRCTWCPRPAVSGALCRLCQRAQRGRRATTRRLLQHGVLGNRGRRSALA